jgi:hypothetical protein
MGCPAAVGREAGVGDVDAVGLDAEGDLVAALTTAEGDREGVVRSVALPLRGGQVVLEGKRVHSLTRIFESGRDLATLVELGQRVGRDLLGVVEDLVLAVADDCQPVRPEFECFALITMAL